MPRGPVRGDPVGVVNRPALASFQRERGGAKAHNTVQSGGRTPLTQSNACSILAFMEIVFRGG